MNEYFNLRALTNTSFLAEKVKLWAAPDTNYSETLLHMMDGGFSRADMKLRPIMSHLRRFNPGCLLLCRGSSAPIPPLKQRNDIGKLLEDEGATNGIEVGVQAGIFAEAILSQWKSCQKYHLVDKRAHLENYKDNANVDDKTQNLIMEEAKKRTSQWGSKVVICRNFSVLCAQEFGPASFDFIYIDARHDYKGVREDLEAYWPKLRKGGIFAGHDFIKAAQMTHEDWGLNYDGPRHEGAVEGAVREFANRVDRQLSITYSEGHMWTTWLMRK